MLKQSTEKSEVYGSKGLVIGCSKMTNIWNGNMRRARPRCAAMVYVSMG